MAASQRIVPMLSYEDAAAAIAWLGAAFGFSRGSRACGTTDPNGVVDARGDRA